MNLTHLSERAKQSGDWQGTSLTASTCKEWLYHRIDTLDVQSAKHDVVPFINDAQQLDIWSKDYFRALADKVTFL